jgi:hypothetical protein
MVILLGVSLQDASDVRVAWCADPSLPRNAAHAATERF